MEYAWEKNLLTNANGDGRAETMCDWLQTGHFIAPNIIYLNERECVQIDIEFRMLAGQTDVLAFRTGWSLVVIVVVVAADVSQQASLWFLADLDCSKQWTHRISLNRKIGPVKKRENNTDYTKIDNKHWLRFGSGHVCAATFYMACHWHCSKTRSNKISAAFPFRCVCVCVFICVGLCLCKQKNRIAQSEWKLLVSMNFAWVATTKFKVSRIYLLNSLSKSVRMWVVHTATICIHVVWWYIGVWW